MTFADFLNRQIKLYCISLDSKNKKAELEKITEFYLATNSIIETKNKMQLAFRVLLQEARESYDFRYNGHTYVAGQYMGLLTSSQLTDFENAKRVIMKGKYVC